MGIVFHLPAERSRQFDRRRRHGTDLGSQSPFDAPEVAEPDLVPTGIEFEDPRDANHRGAMEGAQETRVAWVHQARLVAQPSRPGDMQGELPGSAGITSRPGSTKRSWCGGPPEIAMAHGCPDPATDSEGQSVIEQASGRGVVAAHERPAMANPRSARPRHAIGSATEGRRSHRT
jgi:hypothetical protein